ncbi:RNI-like protein [Patellaria atrata CBS 101060]|uniref:RNI-like protein n=1 Tax=Patellaria atrata CBS 101060 TaxID=1346257 RepID=A0A9P4SE02_9PEZI|nr:RNI-like protein [Patellaria atrata CBS 101060]
MRRYNRGSSGPTIYANKANGGHVPDPISLIRSYDSDTNKTRPVRPSPLTASTISGLPLDLLDRLRSFPLFLTAPDSFLAAIGTHLRPQVHSPHSYILTEGDDAKAMYWLVRGGVRVTSRDGESTYAELKPGAFFGEIGILMDIPRTATIIANVRSLVVRLNKEDLKKELPNFPEVERAIREEAQERLTILERKKKELSAKQVIPDDGTRVSRSGKRQRERADGDIEMSDAGIILDRELVGSYKKRKSPSPSLVDAAASSALGTGAVSVRQLLMELPLFSSLPPEILHFLGLNAQLRTYPSFTDIIQQGSQGRDVFFIVRGEVEVLAQRPSSAEGKKTYSTGGTNDSPREFKARLRPGQYFGEVTSLSLAPRRTATVRTIAAVECLVISGDVLNELWQRCSPNLRRQVEQTARKRLEAARDFDVPMADVTDGTPAIDELAIADIGPRTPKKAVPTVTFSDSALETPITPSRKDDWSVMEPSDPDPFLNVDLDNIRSRSRRGSLAPPSPSSGDSTQSNSAESSKPQSPINGQVIFPSPLNTKHDVTPPDPEPFSRSKKPKIIRRSSRQSKGTLPDDVLVKIFQNLDVYELMKLRQVSVHWMKLLTSSNDILHHLDLTKYNRKVTDIALANAICPFVQNRPRSVDISNCFHVTDEGFAALANACGANVTSWKMKSVWDITGQAVLEMVTKAKGLEEVDLSNCRKVGDNLLARVVGWVVPDLPPSVLAQQYHQQQQQAQQHKGRRGFSQSQAVQQPPQPLPPGTVVGCPRLKKLTLSYCKHITDRSMAHIAIHAANRLEQIDLTRCTTITDNGFQHWSVYPFPRLQKLTLADCTYLTDNAIVYLTNAAKSLRELDLSFCCALSDTATEVLALGCPNLTHLNLAFCGSAVSDGSLRCIGLHLLELKELSVRGCVRVTGIGVEAVVDGCHKLEVFDVSQCKNLQRWLDQGGVKRKGRGIRFETVADGKWRTGK